MIPRSMFERIDAALSLHTHDFQLSEEIQDVLVSRGQLLVPNTTKSDPEVRWSFTDNFNEWYLGSEIWMVRATVESGS